MTRPLSRKRLLEKMIVITDADKVTFIKADKIIAVEREDQPLKLDVYDDAGNLFTFNKQATYSQFVKQWERYIIESEIEQLGNI